MPASLKQKKTLRKRSKRAARTLAEKNIGLAYAFADRRSRRGVPFEDVLSTAFEALVRAAQNYDPTKGRFSTYAWASMSRLVWADTHKHRGVERHWDPLLLSIKRTTFVFGPHSDEHADGSASAPDEAAHSSDITARLLELVPPRDRPVVEARIRGLTLREIGEQVCNPPVTRERVRQIYVRGIRAIQVALRRRPSLIPPGLQMPAILPDPNPSRRARRTE